MRCKNKVIQFVPKGYGFKRVIMQCGNTGIHGNTLLCDNCLEKADDKFPQGWRKTPGDTCKHGYYVGTPGGPDHICPWCEAE